jgi:hypothetical protein
MNSLPSPIDKYDHVYDGGEVRLLYFKNPPATGAYDIECPHCIVVTDGERPRMIVRFERDNHGCMLYSIMPNGDATYYSDVPSLNEAGFVSKVIELFETQKAETNKSEKSDAETKKGYDPIPFSPTLPDITKTEPIKAYLADPYGLYLSQDVLPIGGMDFIKYKFVLALIDRHDNLPRCFVTLENSHLTSNVLCVFEPDGCHANYGSLEGPNLMQEFIERGIGLLRERFKLGNIEELKPR